MAGAILYGMPADARWLRSLRFFHPTPGKDPMDYETIIIGGGPAGCAAAALLAEMGHRVLVLEREKFPRYHIGESLLPFTFYPLQRLGLVEKMRQSQFVK